ncbi:hypothetical protein GF325_04115 [Candidatus Bathyarchaeota archaeon]|nr:hypothetical protein [Candidatus Bathyarchaeota archaeon]
MLASFLTPEMIEDIKLMIRFFAILINFYAAFLVGKRIKEAGLISATTGFTFYLIGNGFFQWGFLIILFYPEWEFQLIFYRIVNTIYICSMALFCFIAEYKKREDDLKHPEYLSNKGEKERQKFHFTWTLIAISALVIFFVLIALGYTNEIGIAFLVMVVPFVATSSFALNKIQSLAMLKDRKPVAWFLVGLMIAGFSNFTAGGEIMETLQGFASIFGTLMMVKGWRMVPPLTELNWYRDLYRLLVLQRKGTLVMFTYEFQKEEESQETNGDHRGDTDGLLAGGALSGIQSLLGEILETKGTDGLNQIDHGGKTIYFNHGENASYVLFTSGQSMEFMARLDLFKLKFRNAYGNLVDDWNGNVAVFKDAIDIVHDVFKF